MNNAGIETLATPAHEVTAHEIQEDLGGVLLPTMYGTAVAVRRMMGSGGSIVNIGSIQGRRAYRGYYSYQSAKAAVEMLSKGVGSDYGSYGIRCNVVLPGTIGVDGADPDDEAEARRVLIPLGRDGTAVDVASAVSFLISEDARYITSAVLVVDGGASSQAEPR